MNYDVIIVGSGPAGSSAALFLSQMKRFSVMVIDRLSNTQFDRYHSVCGEGVSENTFRILGLSPSDILNHIKRTDLVWPGGVTVPMDVKGYIIDRPAFLRNLKDQAKENGVTFIRSRVSAVTRTVNGYSLFTANGQELKCKYIVGADGAHSTVRKCLFGSKPKKMIAAVQYITEKESPDVFTITFDERYSGGYKWAFPNGRLSNEGHVKDSDTVSNAVSKGGRYIPIGGVGEIVDGNAILLGDAAAMANPLSFGGIRAALLSGKMAARAIEKDNVKEYARWWKLSIQSSKRFMKVHERFSKWSNEEMRKAVRPFRSRYNLFTKTRAVISMPWNTGMYIGCLLAFRCSW